MAPKYPLPPIADEQEAALMNELQYRQQVSGRYQDGTAYIPWLRMLLAASVAAGGSGGLPRMWASALLSHLPACLLTCLAGRSTLHFTVLRCAVLCSAHYASAPR